MPARYRFYREHKFVIPYINDTTRLIAKTDFSDCDQVKTVQKRIEDVIHLLRNHAEHEEKAFHTLLERKGCFVHKKIEIDHKSHEQYFAEWRKNLETIIQEPRENFRLKQGYDFYLLFREFEVKNLLHLNNEEKIVMPALQRFYSDDELKAVEANTYQIMSPEEMIEMMEVLFPYMEVNDYFEFLRDIKDATPSKFDMVFPIILQAKNSDSTPIMSQRDREILIHKLSIYFELIAEQYHR